MITITVTETDYFLPEDRPTAERDFLALLNQLTEVWISAYGFTLQPRFDELKQADPKLGHLADAARDRVLMTLTARLSVVERAEASSDTLDFVKSFLVGSVGRLIH